MKKNSLSFFSILLCLILLSSCVSNETANSDTVKQSEIYQSYSVTYNSGDKELSATASFRFGGGTGTSLALTKPGNVQFNNQEMSANRNVFTGTYYEINQQISTSPSDFTFIYTDNDKKSYKNSGSIDAIEIETYPQTISKNGDFEVSWAGKPVQNGESVTVTLEGKDFFSCTQSTSVVGTQSLKLNCTQIKDIKPGNADIVIKRIKNLSLKESTHLGGNFSLEYISKKVGVLIQ
jgi:hypothetical protein